MLTGGLHVDIGFHNSSLYEALRASIGPLVALLRDEEDKTRANAAGALGNLVRNSGLLCRPLIEAQALQVAATSNHVQNSTQTTRCLSGSRYVERQSGRALISRRSCAYMLPSLQAMPRHMQHSFAVCQQASCSHESIPIM